MERKQFLKALEFAIQNEAEARKFYRRASDIAADGALKKLFLELSKEEGKHQAMLERFRSVPGKTIRFEAVPEKLLPRKPGPFPEGDLPVVEALRLAMKKEEEARDLYTGFAKGCDDPEERKFFLDLAAMEMGHRQLLLNAYTEAGFAEGD